MERSIKRQVVAQMFRKVADTLNSKNFIYYRDYIALLKAMAITIETELSFDMEAFFRHYFKERYESINISGERDSNK